MEALQAIADANPGADGHPSRNSGEPGYKASVDYVAEAMRKAGYDVTIQPYTFTYSSYIGTPSLSEVSPTSRSFTLISEWNPGSSQGDATGAQVKPAGHTVMPPTPTPSSASGCDPSDFAGFAGKIALIQRGTCNFGVKVLNATRRERSAWSSSTRAIPAAPARSAAAWSTPTATRSWRASRWRS